MPIDPVRYPATARYVASLPQGLDSYPDCLVKSDAHDGLRTKFGEKIAPDETLPSILRAFFSGSYREEWLPECAGSAVVHLVRDVGFSSDDEYERWAYENNVALFNKPYYRVLTHLLSTTLLLRGAAGRWKALHLGSTMEARPVIKEGGRLRSDTILRFPAQVFDDLDMRNIRSGYLAALQASRASQPEVEVRERAPDHALFAMSWSA